MNTPDTDAREERAFKRGGYRLLALGIMVIMVAAIVLPVVMS